jgi:HEAT repeat protein
MTHRPDDDDIWVFTPGEESEIDDELPEEPRPELGLVIDTMRRGEHQLSMLTGLNDLSVREARQLAAAWPTISVEVRRTVASELGDLAEERFDYTFNRALATLIGDPDDAVRQTAIQSMWGEGDTRHAETLLEILRTDPSSDVRAAAARGLGFFVEMGEFEEIDAALADRIFDALMTVLSDESAPMHLRAKALESVSARSGRPELRPWIEHFFDEDETGYRVTSIFAMGRTHDEAYLPRILNETSSDDAEIRYEAARAAGRIGKADALPVLAELGEDEDAEVRFAAIDAMGEIGGQAAIRYLLRLEERASPDEAELIQDAIAEASIVTDPLLLQDDDER